MLITDAQLAESLVEVTPQRCLVLSARSMMQAFGRPLASPYECCACAMPAKRHDQPCELCGRDVFKPANKKESL